MSEEIAADSGNRHPGIQKTACTKVRVPVPAGYSWVERQTEPGKYGLG